ncbi:MAG: hypothetical protein JRN08_08040 [Nitrososphaerota archaeon]|nr:hypothetical protein [Nitrososphaerota archaeon]
MDVSTRHRITIDSIREVHEALVTRDCDHDVLRLGLGDLKAAGLEGAGPGDALLLRFTNHTRERDFEAFTTLTKHDATLSLRHLDMGVDDRVELARVSRYLSRDFHRLRQRAPFCDAEP